MPSSVLPFTLSKQVLSTLRSHLQTKGYVVTPFPVLGNSQLVALRRVLPRIYAGVFPTRQYVRSVQSPNPPPPENTPLTHTPPSLRFASLAPARKARRVALPSVDVPPHDNSRELQRVEERPEHR